MTTKFIRINNHLWTDSDFYKFLIGSNNIISSSILNYFDESDICYIEASDDPKMVKYLSLKKIENLGNIENYLDKMQSCKIGRLPNKFFGKETLQDWGINDTHVKDFVDIYQMWFDKSNLNFKIVEGEEIKKWFLEENYFKRDGEKKGTLWNSCMRYSERNKFLKLYSNNSKIKMLVLLDGEGDDAKVKARALLWQDVDVEWGINSKKVNVMDRIYSTHDSQVFILKKWAEENGYISKLEQSSKSKQLFDVGGEIKRIILNVKLEDYDFSYYPYLDTFSFLSWWKGTLSNDENSDWSLKLTKADGTTISAENEEYEDEL